MTAVSTRHNVFCDRCGEPFAIAATQCGKCRQPADDRSAEQKRRDKREWDGIRATVEHRRATYPQCPTLKFWDRMHAKLDVKLARNVIPFPRRTGKDA